MTVAQLMKKYTVIYRTRRPHPMFAGARHWTLSCVIIIQYTSSNYNNLRAILILRVSPHLRSISEAISSLEVFGLKFHMNLLSLPCVLHAKTDSRYFDHFNNIWRRVEIVKILIMQLSSVSCYFLTLRPKYPKRPVLGHFHSMKVSRP
jgi:hypothetical protein